MRVQPDRIVVEIEGDSIQAASPRRAEREDLPPTEFVFVRADGWALGAAGPFALAAFRTWRNDWVAVHRLGVEGGLVVEVLTPADFVDRADHYLKHAWVASIELPVVVGDQTLDAPRCHRCGWSVLDTAATLPERLLRDVTCDCVHCRRADAWYEIRQKAWRANFRAQARGDYDEARDQADRCERALDSAGRCLAQCEKRVRS